MPSWSSLLSQLKGTHNPGAFFLGALNVSVDSAFLGAFYRAQSYQLKYFQNSDKILRFLKISSDFQIVFLSKFSEENFQKSFQPAAPKYFVWKFLRFSEKIGQLKILRLLSENFSELKFLLIGLSPDLLLSAFLVHFDAFFKHTKTGYIVGSRGASQLGGIF